MSLRYLINACSAFEKTAGLTFDLEHAKTKAAEIITDMSVSEACQILGVSPNLTFLDSDELMFAFKTALMNLQASPDYGFSKRLMNIQHSIVMAFTILEPIAEKNSEETYAFEGDDELHDQEKVVMPLEAKISQFNILAQQKQKPIVLDPKKKNIDFYTKFLYNAILSITKLVPTVDAAKKLFQTIAAYRQSPGYNQDKELRDVETCLAALTEAEMKLRSAGIDPNAALKTKMPHANPNVLNVLKTNLETLRDAKDFSKYQDYSSLLPDEILPQDQIEFSDTSGPGY